MVKVNPIQERKRAWLREALHSAGGTITDVAERIGWDRSELSSMLNGLRSITDRKAEALSVALNYPLPDMGIGFKPQNDDIGVKASEPMHQHRPHTSETAEMMMMMMRMMQSIDDLRRRLEDLERRGLQEKV